VKVTYFLKWKPGERDITHRT